MKQFIRDIHSSFNKDILFGDLKFIYKIETRYGGMILPTTKSKLLSVFNINDIISCSVLTYDNCYIWVELHNSSLIIRNDKNFSGLGLNFSMYRDNGLRSIGYLCTNYNKLVEFQSDHVLGYSFDRHDDTKFNKLCRLILSILIMYKQFTVKFITKNRPKYTKKPKGAVDHKWIINHLEFIVTNILIGNNWIVPYLGKEEFDFIELLDSVDYFYNIKVAEDARISILYDNFMLHTLLDIDSSHITESIISGQLNGLQYRDNFTHLVNEKARIFKRFNNKIPYSIMESKNINIKPSNYVVYTRNYLLRLINVEE